MAASWNMTNITLISHVLQFFHTSKGSRNKLQNMRDLENISLVIRQKSESQNERYMKTKHVKFSKKTNISCKHFIYLPPDTHFFHDITYWCYSSLLNQVKACQECAFDAHLLANLYPEKVLNIRLYNVVI